MDFNEYQKQAMKTAKEWDDNDMHMAYCALGLVGEAGECCEAIKKHLSGAKKINPDNMKKELGDVLWYVATTAAFFDFDLSDIAQTNIDKLRARHGDKWSGHGNRDGDGA